jgi:hypothetical protein
VTTSTKLGGINAELFHHGRKFTDRSKGCSSVYLTNTKDPGLKAQYQKKRKKNRKTKCTQKQV